MKKILSISTLALVLLVGCGASTDASSESEHYVGQSAESTEEGKEGEYATVEFDKAGDDITNVNFDVILTDGTSKTDLSDSGEYGMEEQTGKSWSAHVAELETYVNDNDAMPELNEEGKDVDGVSGATIGLSQFDEAFTNASAQ